LHRRHLTESQRSVDAAKLKRLLEPDADKKKKSGKSADGAAGGRGKKKNLVANLPQGNGRTRDQAAALLNVSGRSVELVEKLEPLIAKRAKANQSAGGGDRKSGSQNSAKAITKPIDTRAELAKLAGVSHDTIAKGKLISRHADTRR